MKRRYLPIYGVDKKISNFVTTKADIKKGIYKTPPEEYRLDKEEVVKRETLKRLAKKPALDPFFSERFLADHLNEIEEHEE